MKKHQFLAGFLACCMIANHVLLVPLANTVPDENSQEYVEKNVMLEDFEYSGSENFEEYDETTEESTEQESSLEVTEEEEENSSQDSSEETSQEATTREDDSDEETTEQEVTSVADESASEEESSTENAETATVSSSEESSEAAVETSASIVPGESELVFDENFDIIHSDKEKLPEDLSEEEILLYDKLESWMQSIIEEKTISRRIAYKEAVKVEYDAETSLEEIKEDATKKLTEWKQNFQDAFDAFMNVYGYALWFDSLTVENIQTQEKGNGKICLVFNMAITLDPGEVTAEDIINRFYELDETINDVDTQPFFVYQGSGTSYCTAASTAMMLRRRAYLDGNSAWQTITLDKVLQKFWVNGAGMTVSPARYSEALYGLNMGIDCKAASGYSIPDNQRISTLSQYLQMHPEGIALWLKKNNSYQHSVIVTKEVNGVFYCYDPAFPTGNIQRIEDVYNYQLFDSSRHLSQTELLNNYFFQFWYITSSQNTSNAQPPEIISASVVEQTSAGYRINVSVKRGSNDISRVQFPTWTVRNDQDDLVSDWYNNSACSGKYIGVDTSGNAVYTYWVHDMDHNYEKGDYVTHIYVYDTAGNNAIYHMPVVNLKNDGSCWGSDVLNGHEYWLVTDNLSWEEAKEACENAGGHLATITSAEEQNLIQWLLEREADYGNDRYIRELYYLGGTVENSKVSWITGEETTYSPQWSAGQPDNFNNEENILTIYSAGSGKGAGTWNDMRPDSNICGYILEIEPNVTSIMLSNSRITLRPGRSQQISAILKPDNTYRQIKWQSSDSTVATVNEEGVVYAKRNGTAIITATVDGKSASCTVYVGTSVDSFVRRLYENILNREPDQAGFSEWTKKLTNRSITGAQAAYQFAFSDEYVRKNASDTEFINTMYLALLGRSADAAGRNNWQEKLDHGVSREYIFKAFADSSEFAGLCKEYGIDKGTITLKQNRDQNYKVTSFVSRCYSDILNRKGDVSGLNDWTGKLLSKKIGGGMMVAQFMSSTEFRQRNIPTAKTVDIVYKVMLDRAADAAGKSNWTDIADSGVSTDYLVRGFASAPEFVNICTSYGITAGTVTLSQNRDKNIKVTRFVSRCYEKALGRRGDTDGLNNWTGHLLNHTLTPENVAHNFVFSDEVNKKQLNNTEFINMLYRVCLGREADAAGRENWVRNLQRGMSRETVFNQFAQSKEFKEIVASYGL